MPDDVGFQRGGEPAATAQGTGKFGAWVHEKPWHFWVTVAIGLLGVYLAYRAFSSYQANNAGSSSSGSVLGSSGVLDPGATGVTTGTTGATTPPTAAPFWSALLGINPLVPANEGHYFTVGEAGAPQLTTLQQIANAFHLTGGVKDLTLNPNNKALAKDSATQTLAPGTQVWVTTSTINPNAPNALG